MANLETNDPSELAPTRDLAAMASGLAPSNISETARRWAKHCVLDWIAVTVGGVDEPLTRKLIDVALAEGAIGQARIIGHPEKLIASQAALVNGAASHALDYDDVNQRMMGHPTVPVVPTLMALADEIPIDGESFLAAFIAGYEVEVQLVDMMGLSHYDAGWHTTGTVGSFGAAAAAAKILGLDGQQTATALGIAATQTAGLKAMFGTMCKPLHAGKAASNGLLAARLAAEGFTSRVDAIECPYGFAATQAASFVPGAVRPDPAAPYAVEENLFKYHAACYLTHAGMDALQQLREENRVDPAEVIAVRQRVKPANFSVCNIQEPETGLEVKFSMRHTAAMTLFGIDTGALASYTDEIAHRPDLVRLREKVEVIGDDRLTSRMQAEVEVDLADGRMIAGFADCGVPAGDLDEQERRLTIKFHSLVSPVFGDNRASAALDACLDLDSLDDVARVFDTVTG
ncbi:MAG: MmgE/PrpD family protein [Rhodospirillaceae bacterium]|nr:MmgE/PrpD family protein [Rhodospirillaceae bacterium]